jgi:hypothetical protein
MLMSELVTPRKADLGDGLTCVMLEYVMVYLFLLFPKIIVVELHSYQI